MILSWHSAEQRRTPKIKKRDNAVMENNMAQSHLIFSGERKVEQYLRRLFIGLRLIASLRLRLLWITLWHHCATARVTLNVICQPQRKISPRKLSRICGIFSNLFERRSELRWAHTTYRNLSRSLSVRRSFRLWTSYKMIFFKENFFDTRKQPFCQEYRRNPSRWRPSRGLDYCQGAERGHARFLP